MQLFDHLHMRWLIKRSWRYKNKPCNYQASVRLFFLPEIKALLELYGLILKNVWGDYQGNKFTLKSYRLLLLSQKQKNF